MANKKHLDMIKSGHIRWNDWRKNNRNIIPDLSDVDLSNIGTLMDFNLVEANFKGANLEGLMVVGTFLMGANFEGANLIEIDLSEANLNQANLSHVRLDRAQLESTNLVGVTLNYANLSNANLKECNLSASSLVQANLNYANLSHAQLWSADLTNAQLIMAKLDGADLTEANLSNANLINADLRNVRLVQANLQECDIRGSRVFGISTWKLNLENTKQTGLIISNYNEPEITVDNLEIAQFIYMLINNKNIRSIIETVATKAILILGSFSDSDKVILDAIRDELRHHDYVPIVFDFDKPNNRDLTETVYTLALLARYIIVDLTNASSVPHELATIVPNIPSIPIQPIILAGNRQYSMFEHFSRYDWVLPRFEYKSKDHLMANIRDRILQPLSEKLKEIRST
jgi:uncharacterized protein YjbI with pentapeptide repeats